MKTNNVLMGWLAIAILFAILLAILLALGGLFGATASAAPKAAPVPNAITLGIRHSLVTSDDRPSHMEVSISGAGIVDVVRLVRDGTSVTKTVTLSLSPRTFRSTGHRDKTPIGANIRNGEKLLIWSSYNISHLPCATGQPSMRFVRGATGTSFSVSNPTSNAFWAVVNQTLGGPITNWRQVAPGATVVFNSLPAAATGYVAIHAQYGPDAVCSNLGWDLP